MSSTERVFDCSLLDEFVDEICTPSDAEVQCDTFEVNVCAVSATERSQLCKDGYATEFIRKFPCYCDDRCLSKIGAAFAGAIFGLAFFAGLICVVLRRYRGPVPEVEIEKRLSVARADKPDPRVSQCSMNSFKWIPFVSSVVLSLWFIVSTGVVIAWNKHVTVSTFQVSYMMISTTFMVFWLFSNTCLIINGARGLHLLKRELANDKPVEHTDTVHHLIILPNFKEETEVMRNTILRLADQQFVRVKENVTIVLAMEQGEEGYWEKAKSLRDEFLPLFCDVVVTCHPRLKGEQPGKSSNMKWAYAALQQFANGNEIASTGPTANNNGAEVTKESGINFAEDAERYFEHPDLLTRTVANSGFSFDPERTVVTLMDADALSHKRFLSSLSKRFEEEEGAMKHMRFWQCPVAFYENLAEIDFINRAVTIVFAFNELANTGVVDLGLVGSNPRVPVNTYSLSWRLFDLIEGGDNFVVADESHNLFKAFHLTKGLVRLDPIFLPISVYNVTSDNFLTGFKARFTQIKRWMYGNSFEFSFWYSRYVGCSRSGDWHVPLLDKLPILWRLFIFSSFNLVQPLFFSLYGLSWAFYLDAPYFKTLATICVTFIMTTFMVINVSIFVMHWLLIDQLKIEAVQKWPWWKKISVTIFDAIFGIGAATIFYVYFAGLAASAQLLFTGGLKWGTEGRAKRGDADADADAFTNEAKKLRSASTTAQAKRASELFKGKNEEQNV